MGKFTTTVILFLCNCKEFLLDRVDFPFVVLLASGGHCLLAVARDVSDFLLLGTGLDDSPGDAFDKVGHRFTLFVCMLTSVGVCRCVCVCVSEGERERRIGDAHGTD